jgi:hypothetical protein
MSANGIGALERGDRLYPYRETVALLTQALGLSAEAAAELHVAATRAPRPRAAERQSAPTTERLGHNLPLTPTRFLGRERELAELRTLLDDQRLVTLTRRNQGIGDQRTPAHSPPGCGAENRQVRQCVLLPAPRSSMRVTCARSTYGRRGSAAMYCKQWRAHDPGRPADLRQRLAGRSPMSGSSRLPTSASGRFSRLRRGRDLNELSRHWLRHALPRAKSDGSQA